MASAARALVAATLLVAASAYAPNAPKCAANVASALDDFTGIAAGIIASTSDCTPDPIATESDPSAKQTMQLDCAANILGIFSNVGHAGSKLSSAVFNCGNVDSSCAQQTLGTVDDFNAGLESIVAAVSNCPHGSSGSGILCAKDVIGAVNDFTIVAKDIDSSVQRCRLIALRPAPGKTTTPSPLENKPAGANCRVNAECASARCTNFRCVREGQNNGITNRPVDNSTDVTDVPLERRLRGIEAIEAASAKAIAHWKTYLPKETIVV